MPALININGAMSAPEDARIPVLDHGFLFGDSVYETLRTYRRKPFLFAKHFARLEHSAAAIYLQLPWTKDRMLSEVRRAIDAAGNEWEFRIRIIVTRGVGELNLDPSSCASPNVIIVVTELPVVPPAVYEKGVDAVISSVHRIPQFGASKTGNLIRQVLALREAKTKSAFEAILLTPDGKVSDGITSNIYLVKGKTLLTPSLEAGIVEGITRGVVLDLARRVGMTVVEGLFNPIEIDAADEMFLTSTTREVVPIVRVNGKAIGDGKPGKTTLHLIEAYRRAVGVLIQED
jgi:branched-chain amino acid aminotransferase